MDARIRFYEITQCGYYDHGSFQFGGITDILENLKTWITDRPLNETQTYSIDPDNNESDLLRTFCYSVDSNSGEYLMTTWNENADVGGKQAAIDGRGITGSATIETAEPPEGYIPGYPAFFWFIPNRNIFATIQLNTRLNGRRNLNSYLQGFLEQRSKYVVFDETREEYKILGYGLSKDDYDVRLQPRFNSALKKQPGVIEYIRNNRASIRKMIKKDKFKTSRNENVTNWQAVCRIFMGRSVNTVLQNEHKVSIELEMTPTISELEDIIAQWEIDKQTYPSADVGFDFIRGTQTWWLGHSIASDSFDLDIHFTGENVLVPPARLLSELQRRRAIILNIIRD